MSNASAPVGPEILVTPDWLRRRLDDPSVRLVDVRAADSFAKGHIQGAANIDLYAVHWHDTSPEGLRTYQTMMEKEFAAAGVTFEHTVVFYQGNSGMVAARGYWLLDYFGHPAPRILDGGLKAWAAAGCSLTSDDEAPAPAAFTINPQPEKIATYAYVRDHLDAPDVQLFDVRTPEEYYGEHVRAARGGAIPGAVHREWTDAISESGAFKPTAELRAMYDELGLSEQSEIIPYCQGGFRSAHAYVALRILGYPRLRNCMGSWKEWGDRTELPIETPQRPAAA